MEALISVIMPVYNGASTLERSIEAVLAQTYSYWELIVVDNASDDNSAQIAKKYSENNASVRLVQCPDRGVSNARNAGIRNAKGKFVVFADCDDCMEQDFLEVLLCNMERMSGKGRLVIAGYNGHLPDKAVCGIREMVPDDSNAQVCLYLFQEYFLQPLWNKMYEKKFITNAFPVEIYCGEDLIFNVNYIRNIQTVNIVDRSIYQYTTEPEHSSSGRFDRRKFEQTVAVYENFEKLYKELGGKNCTQFYAAMYDELYGLYWTMQQKSDLSLRTRMKMMSDLMDNAYIRQTIPLYQNTKEKGLFPVLIKYRLKVIIYIMLCVNKLLEG